MIFLNDEDEDTRHTYHDIRFLPLGRRSAITIGHEMVLHIVSFRQSRRSSSLALYNHWVHHWKRGTSVLAACKFIAANQSKLEGRSHLRQQQQQFSTTVWTWDVVWELSWLSLSVLRRLVVDVVVCKRVMCVALIPDILSYGKMLSMIVIHTFRQ